MPRSDIGFLKVEESKSSPIYQEKIVLTSYPRSGNTLIRTYLEKLTRVFTGSDCDVRRPLNKQLQDMGMEGEGQIDNRVWIVKSHFPERIGRAKFAANKCIIIVRNPLDSIFSLFNMVATTTHSESICKEALDKLLNSTNMWEKFIRQEVSVWADFHIYWLEQRVNVPTYFIRYEDLIEQPNNALREMSKFILGEISLEEYPGITSLIDEITNTSNQQSQKEEQGEISKTYYKPRSGKINANLHLYSLQQLTYIYKGCNTKYGLIEMFDYVKYFEQGLQQTKQSIGLETLIKETGQTMRVEQINNESLTEMIDRQNNKKNIKVCVTINSQQALLRPKTEEDPTRRGQRPFKKAFREILSEFGQKS